MTDTLRAALEPTLRRLVYAIEDNETIRYRVLRPVREGEPWPSDDQEVIDALVAARAALASAPAGAPRPGLYGFLDAQANTLAAHIREIDGNHDTGAGRLADQLIERGWRLGASVDTGQAPTEPSTAWRLYEAARKAVELLRDGGEHSMASALGEAMEQWVRKA